MFIGGASFGFDGVSFRETRLESVLGQILIGGNVRRLSPVLVECVSVLSVGSNPYVHRGEDRLETFEGGC